MDGRSVPQENSRRQDLLGSGADIPEIIEEEGAGLLGAAKKFGWIKHTEMGVPLPIPLAEILPALGAPGSPLQTWRDAVVVSEMCEYFCSGLRDGRDPFSIPPWERK